MSPTVEAGSFWFNSMLSKNCHRRDSWMEDHDNDFYVRKHGDEKPESSGNFLYDKIQSWFDVEVTDFEYEEDENGDATWTLDLDVDFNWGNDDEDSNDMPAWDFDFKQTQLFKKM